VCVLNCRRTLLFGGEEPRGSNLIFVHKEQNPPLVLLSFTLNSVRVHITPSCPFLGLWVIIWRLGSGIVILTGFDSFTKRVSSLPLSPLDDGIAWNLIKHNWRVVIVITA